MAAREATEDRTEAPTPRRLAEARRRGDLAVSHDLTSAAATAAGIAVLLIRGPTLAAGLVSAWRSAFASANGGLVTAGLPFGLAQLSRALAPPLVAATVAALLVGLAQTRGLLAPAAVAFRFDRVSLAEGLRRLGSGQPALQIAKGLLKGALVAALAVWSIAPQARGLTGLAGAPAAAVLAALGLLGRRLVLGVGLAALALGVADLLFARRAHRRRLRMTRDEVRRERRETEGDPRHRGERRRLHRQLADQHAIADVGQADFVVVDPPAVAVALRYDARRDAAPVVVAGGDRRLAERIQQVARQSGVPVFRDVELARSLRALPDGQEIPPALYQAAAELIRVIQGPGRGPAAPAAAVRSLPHGSGWKRA